jgi:hypothetical protein
MIIPSRGRRGSCCVSLLFKLPFTPALPIFCRHCGSVRNDPLFSPRMVWLLCEGAAKSAFASLLIHLVFVEHGPDFINGYRFFVRFELHNNHEEVMD